MNMMLQYQIRQKIPSDIYKHLPFLFETARRYVKPQIIELGTRSGNSTSAFLAAITTGGHLWSVDIDNPSVPPDWKNNPAWTLIVGDDMDGNVIYKIQQETCPIGADVLFIDTSHTYQHTLDELHTYVPMVRPGGTILMHDTELLMPVTGKTAASESGACYVAHALDAYCATSGLSWVNRPGCCGLGVIEIPQEAHGIS